jgi:hypothetical protein
MKFKFLSLLLAVTTLVLTIACSSGAEGDASVATTFKIDSVVSSGSTNNIEADMLDPEGITADYATIVVSNFQKNPKATPSHLNNVTIYKYQVSFRRTDGGSTVFETFEKNLSQTVEVNSTASFSALIVRLEEKTSGVLAGQTMPLQMEADIKIFGRTGSGDEVTTTGGIAVTIADYNGETPPAASISTFYAVNPEIDPGDTVTLAWYASGAVSEFVLNPGDIHLSVSNYYPYGTIDIPNVTPPQTFTLHAIGMYGSDSKTVDIKIKEGGTGPAINYFGANPTSVGSGSNAVLEWNVTGADTVEIYPEIGNVSVGSGTVTVNPTITTTYTLLATNSGGTSTATAEVTVENSDPVIGLFTAGTSEVSFNDVVHLYWNVYGNYDKLELFPYYDGANDILDVTNMSSVVSKPITVDTTFVLSAFGPNKIVNESVTVTVATTKVPASVQSFALNNNRVSYNIVKDTDSLLKYSLFTVYGDKLDISNASGVVADNGLIKTETNTQFVKEGYSVLGMLLTDSEGNKFEDYRFIANKKADIINSVFLTSANSMLSVELNNAAKVFVKKLGTKDVFVEFDGKFVDISNGMYLPSSDLLNQLKVKTNGEAKLLLVAKDANGLVDGRIITVGK